MMKKTVACALLSFPKKMNQMIFFAPSQSSSSSLRNQKNMTTRTFSVSSFSPDLKMMPTFLCLIWNLWASSSSHLLALGNHFLLYLAQRRASACCSHRREHKPAQG